MSKSKTRPPTPEPVAAVEAPSASPFAYSALPDPRTVTLPVLHSLLGAPPQACRDVAFLGTTAEDFIDDGADIDSKVLIDFGPNFVFQSVKILSGLTEEQSDLVMLDPAIPALLVEELLSLESAKRDFDVGKSSDVNATVTMASQTTSLRRAGIALRDRVYEGAINALGPAARPSLDAVTGTAEDNTALATGLDTLAAFISQKLSAGTAAEKHALTVNKIHPGRVTDLRKAAESLRAAITASARPARVVDQNALDLQDGRVLFLIEKILRALRSARKDDAAIALPDLGSIAWRFTSRPKRRKVEKPEEPHPNDPTPAFGTVAPPPTPAAPKSP